MRPSVSPEGTWHLIWAIHLLLHEALACIRLIAPPGEEPASPFYSATAPNAEPQILVHFEEYVLGDKLHDLIKPSVNGTSITDIGKFHNPMS